jgi:hypothetical protein
LIDKFGSSKIEQDQSSTGVQITFTPLQIFDLLCCI